MKNLELNQMEVLEGGNDQAIVCGISVGLMLSGAGFYYGAFLFLAVCINGDTTP